MNAVFESRVTEVLATVDDVRIGDDCLGPKGHHIAWQDGQATRIHHGKNRRRSNSPVGGPEHPNSPAGIPALNFKHGQLIDRTYLILVYRAMISALNSLGYSNATV